MHHFPLLCGSGRFSLSPDARIVIHVEAFVSVELLETHPLFSVFNIVLQAFKLCTHVPHSLGTGNTIEKLRLEGSDEEPIGIGSSRYCSVDETVFVAF